MFFHDWIGQRVIAVDKWWGTYDGVLVDVTKSYVGMIALVEIGNTLQKPRQDAILFTGNYVLREEYPAGAVKRFLLDNVKLVEVDDEIKTFARHQGTFADKNNSEIN